ncbi:MAG TPA: hypothetical protein VK157_02615 [Phycisphaerales bacterium]|nr:hypothetical protein [Phycisphaerales bacterium]
MSRALGITLMLLGVGLFIGGLLPLFGVDINGRRSGNGAGSGIVAVLIAGALFKIGWDYLRYGEQRMDLD